MLYANENDMTQSELDLVNNCEVISLLKNMICYDPKDRLKIEEVEKIIKKLLKLGNKKFLTWNKLSGSPIFQTIFHVTTGSLPAFVSFQK